MEKLCKKCGTPVKDGEKVCPNCGGFIVDIPDTEVYGNLSEENFTSEAEPAAAVKKPKKNTAAIVICAVLAAVLAVCGICAAVFFSQPAVKIDRGIRGLLTSEYAFKVSGESTADGVKTSFSGKVQIDPENRTVTAAEGKGQYKKDNAVFGFENLGFLLDENFTASLNLVLGNRLSETYYYDNTVITVVNGKVVMGVEEKKNQDKIDLANGILSSYLNGDSLKLMAAISRNLEGNIGGGPEYWAKAEKDLKKNFMSKKWLEENLGYQGCEKGIYTFDADTVKAITAIEETIKPYIVNGFSENGANQIEAKFAEAKEKYAGDKIKLILTIKDGAVMEISVASGANYDEFSFKAVFEKTEETITYNTEKANGYYWQYQEVKDSLNNAANEIGNAVANGDIEDILNGVGNLLNDIGTGVGNVLGGVAGGINNALGGILSGIR